MSDRAGLRFGALVLFLGGAGCGAYGVSIVRSGSYTETSRDSRKEIRTTTTRGPEAVLWGWTLISGGTIALAWAVLFAWPPVHGVRLFHRALVGLALAAVIAISLLRMPPGDFKTDPRTCAFYLFWTLYLLGAVVVLLFRDEGALGVAVVALILAAGCFYQWGLKGLEGAMLSLMSLMFVGLHVGAIVVLSKRRL